MVLENWIALSRISMEGFSKNAWMLAATHQCWSLARQGAREVWEGQENQYSSALVTASMATGKIASGCKPLKITWIVR